MKYKIAAAINYWDDPRGLLEILETPNFYEHVYVIYLIDGRYKNRRDKEEHNPTLGMEISRHYDKIHYVRMYDVKQIEKRNKYFELAEKDDVDWLIILDSDELLWFEEGFEKSLDDCWDYPAQMFPLGMNHVDVATMPRPRLCKKPFTFRHRQNTGPNISHGQLWSDYGKGKYELIKDMYKYKQDPNTPYCVPHIYMRHDKKHRTKKRVDADYVFYSENPTR